MCSLLYAALSGWWLARDTIPRHSVTARLPSCPLLFCVQLDLSKWHGHFGTLMPFYRAWSTAKPPPSPLPEPKAVPVMPKDPSAL